MEYLVKRIDEPDFGCEGRPEGKTAMDKVWLEDENQQTIVIEVEDERLYALDINENDRVWYSENELRKIWINCELYQIRAENDWREKAVRV